MQTHLSYATYQKLCKKFGKENILKVVQFRFSEKVGITPIQDGAVVFPCLDMNVILSKDFLNLLMKDKNCQAVCEILAARYYYDGMPAVEEYILKLI